MKYVDASDQGSSLQIQSEQVKTRTPAPSETHLFWLLRQTVLATLLKCKSKLLSLCQPTYSVYAVQHLGLCGTSHSHGRASPDSVPDSGARGVSCFKLGDLYMRGQEEGPDDFRFRARAARLESMLNAWGISEATSVIFDRTIGQQVTTLVRKTPFPMPRYGPNARL